MHSTVQTMRTHEHRWDIVMGRELLDKDIGG